MQESTVFEDIFQCAYPFVDSFACHQGASEDLLVVAAAGHQVASAAGHQGASADLRASFGVAAVHQVAYLIDCRTRSCRLVTLTVGHHNAWEVHPILLDKPKKQEHINKGTQTWCVPKQTLHQTQKIKIKLHLLHQHNFIDDKKFT